MKIIKSIARASNFIKNKKGRGQSVGFVPTMGALHNGHLSLIRKARDENDLVAVSIFVNPAQFGPGEDLRRYPRDLAKDSSLCEREKVDILFIPDIEEMYPRGYRTYIEVEGLSDLLCGKSRPRHFRGVATVVTKLFNIISPDNVYFGQKDAQQAVIIKKMVLDLNIPVKVKIMPIVRERDGLALSSRNIYLSKKERMEALVLVRSLEHARDLIKSGVRSAKTIIAGIRGVIQRESKAKIDYIAITDPMNLEPVDGINKTALVALAVWIGKTRLIDNILVDSKGESNYV